MVHRNLFFIALLLGCAPTEQVTLAESVPRETTLDRPDVPNAPDVWLDMIDHATRSLDLAEFYISDQPGSKLHAVLDAVERAAARGVHVRLLVDATFYAKYPEVPDAWSHRANMEVRHLDLKPGVLHAKYFVVDGREAYVGSQNFDWRSLEHIVEMGARVRAPHVVAAVESIFAADWDAAGGKPFRLAVSRLSDGSITLGASPKKLVPENLWDLPRLLTWIGDAKKTLRVQSLTYKTKNRDGSPFHDLDDAVRAAAARGVSVELLVSTWTEKDEAVASLAKVPHVVVRVLDIPKFSGGDIPFARVAHAKFAVFDDSRAWLGTGNWEGDYFLASRNLSLFFDHDDTARELGRVFDDEWQSVYARPPR
ncbi:MAG TPA: phospholipase D-like domain-containing protein [Polyangiaceae bacterium]|jgi:phosphatidylserine/phosphatidylglycerophosphate/cardiolipin synthase-like enzyme